MEAGLGGFTIKRFAGSNRYETNLMILKEAGVGDKDILVATGTNFADSLSASATGKPILLVGTKLTAAQKQFLAGTKGTKYILGGTTAVSAGIENELKAYGAVERLGGAYRYATSVLIAETFFGTPKSAVLSYAQNFPDGLCGGVIAYKYGAPMLLVTNSGAKAADTYAAKCGIKAGYVLGGTGLISDATAKQILG
jgi:putative cell wall-binding protein